MKRIFLILTLGLLGGVSYADTADSIVKLLVTTNHPYQATGFYVKVDKEVFLITNSHFCLETDSKNQVLVVPDKAGVNSYIAPIINLDIANDLCLISPGEHTQSSLNLGNDGRVGERVYVLGHPEGSSLTLTTGHRGQDGIIDVLVKNRVKKYYGFKTTAPIRPGSSGSPVLHNDESVMGIIFAGNQRTNLSDAIPASVIKEFIEEYLSMRASFLRTWRLLPLTQSGQLRFSK